MADDKKERFESLYREHVAKVLAFARTRADPENANDVVSLTFLVAWRRFDAIPSDALPWLIGVARNVLSEQRRSANRQSALQARLQSSEAIDQTNRSGDLAETLIMQAEIRNALKRLRPEDREALTLVAWEGFTLTQLATALNCTKAIASLRLHRARRRFAKYLYAEGSKVRKPAFDSMVARPVREEI